MRHRKSAKRGSIAMIGIAVCNNVVASVKRRARLGVYPPGKPKRVIRKKTWGGAIISSQVEIERGQRREIQLHAIKGYRNRRVYA